MSIPASKEALDDLEKFVEANDKAGDWVYIPFPKNIIALMGYKSPGVPDDRKLTSENILKQAGDIKLPKR